jgi:hypothetical protein
MVYMDMHGVRIMSLKFSTPITFVRKQTLKLLCADHVSKKSGKFTSSLTMQEPDELPSTWREHADAIEEGEGQRLEGCQLLSSPHRQRGGGRA